MVKVDKEANKKILDFFSGLADKTRLEIIMSIAGKPRNVNDIHKTIGKDKITLSAISHQLRLLSDMNIVKHIKKGKEKFYELSEEFCWCILKDAFNQFGKKIDLVCKKCSDNRRG